MRSAILARMHNTTANAARMPATLPEAAEDETAIVLTTSLAHFLCHFGELIFPSVMIAVMAEFGDKRCAFLGDAYSSDIAKSIARMAKAEDGGDVLEVNAVKLSHHGGRKNTGSAMLEKFRCRKYLVSTDGTIYDHPHGESLSRVLVSGAAAGKPSLFFNYLSDETRPWGKKTLFNGDFKYTPVFPDDDPGISVSL